jgi:hypothetical protein
MKQQSTLQPVEVALSWLEEQQEAPRRAPLTRAHEAVRAAVEVNAGYQRALARLQQQRQALLAEWKQEEDLPEEARVHQAALEARAILVDEQWQTLTQQHQAHAQQCAQLVQAFRVLACEAEDALARMRAAVEAVQQASQSLSTKPLARLALELDVDRHRATLARLIGEGEAQALAEDPVRVPSWRL